MSMKLLKKCVPLAAGLLLLTLAAVACSSDPEPAPAIDEAQLRSIVSDAVSQAAPEQQEAVTSSDVENAISKAVSDAQASALTVEQVQAIVDRAVATPIPVAAGDAPTAGGTIRLGVIDQGTLDPMLAGLSQGQAPYGELAYDNAMMYWYDGEVTPWAVESWSSTDDLSQYTLKVRDGISFHSGSPLTSADIKYTLDRIRAEDSVSPLKGQISYIDTIDTPDDSTVVLNLGDSNAFLPGDMTDYHARIVPNGITSEELANAEHGSGPYTLADHNPTERSVFDKYSNYWREGRPFADQVIFFYMSEQITRVEALKTGSIDVVITPPITLLGSFAGNPDVKIADAPSAAVAVIDMHTSYSHLQDNPDFNKFHGLDDPIFADKNLRKAMQYAVDRDFVVQAAQFGRGAPANDHPVGVNDQYYWDDQPIIKQDIQKAKDYLAAAGYADGIDVVLNTADIGIQQEMALAFKESVSKAGINVEIATHDASAYWEAQWMDPCCPFVTSNWGARPANAAIDVQLRGGTVWNESFYNNPRLDELLDLAAASPDLQERKKYFQEMQEILIEDVPVLYLAYQPTIIAHRSNIHGVRAHTALVHFFFEEWWVSDN